MSKAATMIPSPNPVSINQGATLNCLSATIPKINSPSIGANILHVVSAAVASIKTTGDMPGVDDGLSSCFFGDELIYGIYYTSSKNDLQACQDEITPQNTCRSK